MFIKKKLTGFTRLVANKVTAHIIGRIGVGLLIAAPFIIVYLIFKWAANLADNLFGPIKDTIPFVNDVPGLGLVLLAIILYFLGVITLLATGKKIIDFFQKIILKIPLIRSIYKPAKDFADLFLGDMKGISGGIFLFGKFTLGICASRVIVIEEDGSEEPSINFFFITAPNPTSGIPVVVPEREVYELFVPNESGELVPLPLETLIKYCTSCAASCPPEIVRRPMVRPNN